MSDDLRVAPSNLYRNHQDLRVRNAPALDVSKHPKVDFPILSFEDNLFPGSPCPKENVIAKMDSPHLYEEVSNGDKKFPFNLDEGLNIFDLDPNLEDTVDLQEFINSGSVTETNVKVLEQLLSSVKDSDLSCDPLTINTGELQAISADNSHNINIGLGATLMEKDFMTNPEQITTDTTGLGQVLTVKVEDLGLWNIDQTRDQTTTTESQVSSTTISNTPPDSPVYTPLPRGRPGRKPSGAGPVRNNRKRAVPKDTEEYKEKRARNNVAVRKSRDKAKQKQQETQQRVESLCDENDALQKKVELLTKELNVLKGLFLNVGVSIPANFEDLLGKL